MRTRSRLVPTLLLIAITALGLAAQQAAPAAYEAQILAEREQRVNRLRTGDCSPLKKVSSHRLNDSGRVTVGSSPAADIRVEGEGIAPIHVVVEGASLTPTLRAAGGKVFSTWDNKERPTWTLRNEFGFRMGARNILYWVNDATGVRTLQVFDPEAAPLKRFRGLEFFPVDPAFRMTGEVIPFPKPERLELLDSAGREQPFWLYGELRFTVQGVRCALELYTASLEPEAIRTGGFNLMFTDATSGKESYPATRYLAVEGKTRGTVTVDFNRAMTPPCNFSPLYSCPFPRKQNRLPVAIRAGEKWYRDALRSSPGHPARALPASSF